ncbi:MBL fold metallo-hydrolase [Oceanobacillus damuensis]|uniref:MBL fold metallo-hydrolase n=1 Tax=Oceanobacillus damuensis TaxID=937928 RepID=UPI00082D61E2|nr:MBL fold metallo-hydrolase [Oceanobacillus damuensis]
MKIRKISEHIWSLKSWMLISVNVWVVKDKDGGYTLVDAGMPFMAKGILKFFAQREIGPLKRILLTHGHSDHVGALQGILKEKNVPVYAHGIEIPYMEGDQLYPRRKKHEKNVPKGLVKPLETDEYGHLQTVCGLTPYFTPGHSPGHVAYFHEEDRVLLGGDLFTSKKGRLHKPMPMFTGDMKDAVKSGMIIQKLNPKTLEVCHGSTVYDPAQQLDVYVNKMEKELHEKIS